MLADQVGAAVMRNPRSGGWSKLLGYGRKRA